MMTNREKAATYIGWTKWTCEVVETESNRICWKCNDIHVPAPDMRRPENYMRALMNIAERVHRLVITHTENDWHIVSLRAANHSVYRPKVTDESLAEAVVKFCAEFYDLEHKD